MTLYRLLFIFIFFLTPLSAYSQLEKHLSFKQLSIEQGLSQNSVVSIAQDSTGYLWFATQDGLNKYNGKDFTYFNERFEDITRENFSKLGSVVYSEGNDLFIITIEGDLKIWNRQLDAFEKFSDIKSPSKVHSNDDKVTWVGTYGNGLYKISSEDTVKVFKNEDAIRSIYDLYEYDSDLFVAASGGVFSVNTSSNVYSKIEVQQDSETINFSSIEIDATDNLWVGSYGAGLFVRKATEDELIPFLGFNKQNGLPANLNIEDLLIDSKERLWVATYGQGAFLIDFENEHIEQFLTDVYKSRTIHYNDILCLFEDQTGTIWFGTDGAGASYYDENLFKFNSLNNNEVPLFAKVDVARAISVDPEGRVWIGTSGKGLTLYNAKQKKYVAYLHNPKDKTSFPSNRIMSLLSDKDTLWVGLQDEGLAIIEEGIYTKVFNQTSNPPLPATTIWSIFKDSKDRFWLGTRDGGLIQFDLNKGTLRHYVHDPEDKLSISENNVRVITEGINGDLWIGTEGNGLNKFIVDKEVFIHYDSPEIMSIKSLYADGTYLWIGTNGNGLYAMDTTSEKLFGYTMADGLPNNVIYSILPGDSNTIWLSSNRGISSFTVDKPGEKAVIVNYDTNDGLQALEFNTGAAFKDHDGYLYFGGLKGVSWFKPSEITINPHPPRTTINRLEIFNDPVELKPGMQFKHSENTLTFSFSGLHFGQPDRNQYTYLLENYDQEWSRPGLINSAHYTNLAPGDYSFKVKSSNYDNIWNEVPSVYSFTIRPPWYLTTVAKISYFLLAAIILFLVYKYLQWRWEIKHELLQEHEETERLKKLAEYRSKLYTNISHEFRTPLTLISGPVSQLLSSFKQNSKEKKALEVIDGSSQRMLRLVNQLLELSQLEDGIIKLNVRQHDLKTQIIQIVEAFNIKANEKGITIISEIDEFEESWYDKDVIEKIVTNLLSNAIKYAPESSTVHFDAMARQNDVVISVENFNTSLKENELGKLFERFYQSDKANEGVGIGLSLIKELAVLSGGNASVRKKTKDSISFSVNLPITKDSYSPNVVEEDSPEFTFAKLDESVDIFRKDLEEIPLMLIVEDNSEVRNYIVSLFEENYKILEADNGLAGIKSAIRDVPDIIISDIMMPKKDGVELCTTLKNDIRTSHIPIILLTARVGDENELIGLQNRADDYITKPFNPELLIQKAGNCVQTRKELQKRYSQQVFLRPKDIAVTSLDEEFLNKIQKIIDTRMTDPDFKAEDFARELHLSRMQLHRKLKALTGLNTTEFIRSQRLKTATTLLSDSELTVSEVAYSVGFNTPSYFIKCFKEAYNCTPSEYISE